MAYFKLSSHLGHTEYELKMFRMLPRDAAKVIRALYTSALNLYLTFGKLHNFNIDPTPETLSLYVTYQSTFINPKSVDSYLSGIANQMESFFPDV